MVGGRRSIETRRCEQVVNRNPSHTVPSDGRLPGPECRPTLHTPLGRWTLTLQDGGSVVGKWIWEEFQALPRTELTVNIHCVTKWSKRQCTALG